jgi:predicted transcriptional regulator
MLGALLGSVNKERVLVFLAARNRGYGREIARFFNAPLYPIRLALASLESTGVLVSRSIGTTREYEFNPQYAARDELKSLIGRALELYPSNMRDKLLLVRSRPRRKSKPL